MKLYYTAIIALLCVALAGVSCSKNQFNEQQPEEKQEEQEKEPGPDPEDVVIGISIEANAGLQGRTAISEDGSPGWLVGDKVAVWDGYGIREFTVTMDEDKPCLSGKAVPGVKYWAVYPYDGCKGVDDSDAWNPVFDVEISAMQALVKGSVPSGALACIGNGTKESGIVFKHICGIVSFSFPSAEVSGRTMTALMPGSLNHIGFTSIGGVPIAGSVSVSLDGEVPSIVPSEGKTASSLDLSFESLPQAGATYYFCILPCELGGNGGGINVSFSRSEDKAVAEIGGGTHDSIPVLRACSQSLGELWPEWHAADDTPGDLSADPAGAYDYSLLSRISHPRILASDEDFRVLRSLLEEGSYPELNRQHDAVIEHATQLLSKTIPTIPELDAMIDPETGSYQNTFNEKLARATINHLVNGSYAYRMTGDKRFLDDVRTVIAQRCADAFWSKHPEGKSIAYLSPAEIAMGMAVAYDWLYYDLTETERSAIRAALKDKPFTIGESKVATSYLKNEVNNRGQVHNAGIMATALALYDKDKAFANKWMEYCNVGIQHIVEGVYGTTGSTQEGYGYWEYGTSYFAFFEEMLYTVFGSDNGLSENPGFKLTGDYNLYMTDHLSSFAFSDGGRDKLSCQLSPWWLAARFQRPELLLTELYLHTLGRKVAHRIMAMVPFCLSKYPKLELTGLQRPSSDVWADSNDSVSPVVLARTGWTCTDGDKYLGLKGGYASVSHGHMDAGTFEYHANGVRWSVDNSVGGYALYTNKGLSSASQTATSGYVKWLAMAYNSLGHSTISFANYDKTTGGVTKTHATDHLVASNYKATILETYDSNSEKGGKIDMSKPLKGQVKSATRKAVIKDGSYLLVEDCIEALSGSDAKMIWRMVIPSTVVAEIIGGKSIKLTQSGHTMYIHPEFSGSVSNLVLKNWGDFDKAHPGLTGEWGWTAADHKVKECIKANVVGFTVTIPKGTKVTVSTTLTEYDPAAASQGGVGGETPDFGDGENYNW